MEIGSELLHFLFGININSRKELNFAFVRIVSKFKTDLENRNFRILNFLTVSNSSFLRRITVIFKLGILEHF